MLLTWIEETHTVGGDRMIEARTIKRALDDTRSVNLSEVLEKCKRLEQLNAREVARLLKTTPDERHEIKLLAGEIKKRLYGNRVVLFAPLYLSDYCINNCSYCGYRNQNRVSRRKLSKDEVQSELRALERMGHRRLALEFGEDPKNCDMDYVISSIDTIYDSQMQYGGIRRVNVNLAGTTVENYRRLKKANIGTYILFQETYDRDTYREVHVSGPKSDYEYHLLSFDRAMQAGIDDVGGGVLFGLYDYMYEILGLFLHDDHLKKKHGVGFHTVSIPRIRAAQGVDLSSYSYLVDDEDFKHIVSVIRLAMPNVGIILSTRESRDMRNSLLRIGATQISAGSATGVGGYSSPKVDGFSQFEVEDHRHPREVISSLLEEGYIPSHCTACYRKGRVGEQFMELNRTGEMKNICSFNAIMTLLEYEHDFGDRDFSRKVDSVILKESIKFSDEMKYMVAEKRRQIKLGVRDIYI